MESLASLAFGKMQGKRNRARAPRFFSHPSGCTVMHNLFVHETFYHKNRYINKVIEHPRLVSTAFPNDDDGMDGFAISVVRG
jgi:hypothetical protein